VAERTGVVGERNWLWQAFAAPGVTWLFILFLTPFYAILAVSMGTLDPIFLTAEPVWNPLEWNPGIYGDALREIVAGSLTATAVRTIAYVAIASLLCIVIGYPVAYYVSRRAGRWKILLLVLMIAPFWINYLMRMLAWVNLLDRDGYVNQILMALQVFDEPREWLVARHETVILGLVYGYIPFFVLPLFAALDRIDERVIEASRDLGANPFWTFLRVTLPLSKQGILAGTVIIMLPMFGDYYTPNILSGSPKTKMFGNEIEQFITSGVGGSQGAALTIILMGFVGILMAYYLISVARATREVRAG
jgi:spermidine/putrescine transport system permease protein